MNSETIVKSLELPKDLFLGVPVFTMYGNGELLIENHRGILIYGQEQMTVRSKRSLICIEGRNLRIDSYTADSLLICGDIEGITFHS